MIVLVAVVAMIVMMIMIMVVAITMVMVVVTMIVMVVTVMMVVMIMLLRQPRRRRLPARTARRSGLTLAPRLCSSVSIAGSRLSRSRRSNICTGTWRSPRCQASRASAARSRRANLDQRLGFGHDLDQFAVVEHQRIVGAQPHRFGEIELDAGAFDAEHEALLRLALRIGQDQRVDDGAALAFGGRLDAWWRGAWR